MTTLYRPVKITSTDLPMGKFPEGTIATHPDHWPVERCSCSRWESEGGDRYDPDMVGWTALVPIEAEEEVEAASHVAGKLTDFGVEFTVETGDVATRRRRYVTPWVEDALPAGVESATVPWGEA